MSSKILGKNIELRKAIIKKYVNKNGFIPNIDMLKYLNTLKDENNEFKYKNLDYRNLHEEHLKKISGKDGVLSDIESAIVKEQALKGYSLKKDLKTLGIVFYHVYAHHDRWELLGTSYFEGLIDPLIENFNLRLEQSKLRKRLTPGESEHLKCCIRYPAVASFILCEGISVTNVLKYQKTQDERMLNQIKKYVMEVCEKEFKHNDQSIRFLSKWLTKFFNISSQWIKIFDTLIQTDRFSGRVPSDIDIEYQKIIDGVEGPRTGKILKDVINEMDNEFS